jgi:hypothetical protein
MDSIDREVAKNEKEDAAYRERLEMEKSRTVHLAQPTFGWVFLTTLKVWISVGILMGISWLLWFVVLSSHRQL